MPVAASAVGEALLESERRYFALGARVEFLRGARIAVLREARSIPAGCVVHPTGPLPRGDADAWIDAVESRVRALDATHVRIYLEAGGALADGLGRRGYVRTEERVHFAAAPHREGPPYFRLRAASMERDWRARERILASLDQGPDDHTTPPDLFIRMERLRCATGEMEPYLLCGEDGEPVGAVCALPVNGVLRVKNLFVHAEHHRRGAATAALSGLARLAHARGLAGIGSFVREGGLGERVQRAAGIPVVARQTEWIRRL